MICPYCSTENRNDRESCYHCGKDISMLRLIVNKARHHYNAALEHAERERFPEALAELEHSIDLDYHFAPAHVVMGTVYAKMERFQDAQRCWNAALELDPNIKKAHAYLEKSDVVQSATPLVRRLNRWTWASIATAAVFVLLSVWRLWPSGDRNDLAEIDALLEKGDLAAAYERAQRLEHSAGTSEVRRAARLFVDTIGQRYENAAVKMLTCLLDGEPLKVHALYVDLAVKQSAPERYRMQLEPLDRKAAEQAIERLEAWLGEYEAQTLSYEDFIRRTEEMRAAFDRPGVTNKADIVLAAVRRARANRTLAMLPDAVDSTSETLKWLGRLRALAAELPEVRDEVDSATARLVSGAFSRISDEVAQALRAGDTETLQLALSSLELLEPYGLPDGAGGLAERIRKGLERVDVGRLLGLLESATIEDIPQVAVMTAQYEGMTSATFENADEVHEAIVGARRRLAFAMHRWMEERDSQYETRGVSTEDAQFTVDRVEFVLRYIRGRDWRYVRDNTMFYALSSWLKLGDEAEAEEWYQRLVDTYPESPYVERARQWRQSPVP